ncbi:hypothetical protein CERZMDRAFT_96414 [Cercospora zeae-maydis SCOH1-5]|uniref:Uncharacterized protein n=1 Tax=Cercospora zeae-maydis SCOH1-5 TaxID=717836 RepID=A0A6A6FJG9_9PEZI|nr:hypothetical protein CERZMDRAFT_96414 [Cercospora zeae-maydis SCOH1-5]
MAAEERLVASINVRNITFASVPWVIFDRSPRNMWNLAHPTVLVACQLYLHAPSRFTERFCGSLVPYNSFQRRPCHIQAVICVFQCHQPGQMLPSLKELALAQKSGDTDGAVELGAEAGTTTIKYLAWMKPLRSTMRWLNWDS